MTASTQHLLAVFNLLCHAKQQLAGLSSNSDSVFPLYGGLVWECLTQVRSVFALMPVFPQHPCLRLLLEENEKDKGWQNKLFLKICFKICSLKWSKIVITELKRNQYKYKNWYNISLGCSKHRWFVSFYLKIIFR